MSLAMLTVTNALWSRSGYGTQGLQWLTRVAKDGHKVAVAANYGLEGTVTEWAGIPHFPRGTDRFSNDVVTAYFEDWSARHPNDTALLATLYDVWVLNASIYDKANVLSWVPIDSAPVAKPVAAFLRKPNVTPVAMSKFGRDQMLAAGIDCEYVPHAIDTELYKHTASVETASGTLTGRQLMGFDDDVFVVGAFNANQDSQRKAWPEILLAFSLWAKNHDDARLYIHTERHGAMGGLKLDDIAEAVGLKPHQFKIVNQYAYRTGVPTDAMAALYSAADVMLAPTYGEGFGLTVLEAQSCGTPVIVNDYSAQSELCGDGWLTTNRPVWNREFCNWWKAPDIISIMDSLEGAYQRGRGFSDVARAFAVQYDADLVYRQQWHPLLKKLQA
ncbi:Glycosyl transferase, family 1 [uncultured Caudovirales phage]|uniref:Glycosyl transferase, family 1 n=1 Tax=uncultured Caudovirales phage TaxID=2100421 RepID=A0A6J7WIE6_9CAUD|nr:Glycosyl transferase, family 1 [uncultured Caudovirales phage]